jgi:hypothetical protein
MQLIEKMRRKPWQFTRHRHSMLLMFILAQVQKRKNPLTGAPIQIHLHKVRAHTDILGNKKADTPEKKDVHTQKTPYPPP